MLKNRYLAVLTTWPRENSIPVKIRTARLAIEKRYLPNVKPGFNEIMIITKHQNMLVNLDSNIHLKCLPVNKVKYYTTLGNSAKHC